MLASASLAESQFRKDVLSSSNLLTFRDSLFPVPRLVG